MRKYLVPIGDAEHSASTLQYAIDLAKDVGAELFVTKIYTAPTANMAKLGRVIEEDMQGDLDQLLAKVDTKGVKINVKPIKGRVEDSIGRLGSRIDANMIILSSTTAERDESIYIGKISGALVKHTELPIMVVPPDYKYTPTDKVLFAFRSGILKKKTVKGTLKVLSENIEAKITPLQVIIPKMKEEDKVISTSLLMISEPPKIIKADSLLAGIKEEIQKNKYDIICVVRRKPGVFKKFWEDARIRKKDFDPKVPILVLS